MAIFKPYKKDIDYFFLQNLERELTQTTYFNNIDIVINNDIKFSNIKLLTNQTVFTNTNRVLNVSESEYTIENHWIFKYPINNYLIGNSFLLNENYDILILFCFINDIPNILINYKLFYSTDKFDKKIIKNLLNGIQNSCFEDITTTIFKYQLPLFKEMKTNSKHTFNINESIHQFLNTLTEIE